MKKIAIIYSIDFYQEIDQINQFLDPQKEQSDFNKKVHSLNNYLEKSSRTINDKTISLTDIQYKIGNLKDMKYQLKKTYKIIYKYKSQDPPYVALPLLNEELEKLLRQKTKELGYLIKSATQKIKCRKLKEESNSQRLPTSAEALRQALFGYGFFDLPRVKQLSPNNQTELVQLISVNKLPYKIAMLHSLGFLTPLVKQHFKSKKDLYKKLSAVLGSDKEGRAVKGNINALSTNTAENKSRYTAPLHKNQVEEDYNLLK